MNKRYRRALFIFRRDLRLEDNTGLIFALEQSEEVVPCFILTPEQIEHNPYRSNRCLQFMLESLEELEEALRLKKGKLYRFFGKPYEVTEECIQKLKIDAVVVNRDYTPYSLKRDGKIESVCKKYEVAFHSLDDILLQPMEETLKKDGKPYTVFTPYYRHSSKIPVLPPAACRSHHYYSHPISFAKESRIDHQILPQRLNQASGGRKAALKILKDLRNLSHYATLRDFPAQAETTRLSAHLKFTTCSPREIYHAIVEQLGPHSDLIRSLYWRDFFTSIAFYFPFVFERNFREKFDRLSWSHHPSSFKHWCEGTTGFPIVDAGMRQLNETGYMHNRVRMIAASFLVKDLHIDWRLGERYFAQTLIDYDPALNNGNWQWVASTGCDAQPYFRIFNPWNQQKKFDPDCHYIKQWVPELSKFSANTIHAWFLEKHSGQSSYPTPMVDHSKEARISLMAYKKTL